jgi:hypothetical protein
MRGWLCRLQLLVVLASAVILKSKYSGTHDHILLSQIRDSPSLEGQVPVFISPNRVARLYTQVLGSLFDTSCDSQGYNGGIKIRLHTGISCSHGTSPLATIEKKLKCFLRGPYRGVI